MQVYKPFPCIYVCYTEKATPARHRPERQDNARSNRRKQRSPNGTKPYSNPTPPRKRQTTPRNGHTPRRMKPTHTRLTYTRMRPHAPSHQAGDHPVPAHCDALCSYKRVKGRSHTVENRISMHPPKPHVTSQPSRFHAQTQHIVTTQLAYIYST